MRFSKKVEAKQRKTKQSKTKQNKTHHNKANQLKKAKQSACKTKQNEQNKQNQVNAKTIVKHVQFHIVCPQNEMFFAKPTHPTVHTYIGTVETIARFNKGWTREVENTGKCGG